MVTANEQVCNMALARIGAGTVSDIDSPTSTAEKQCNLFYTQTRDELLREFPWPFATTRAQLNQATGDNYSGYDYKHQLPNNCLYVQGLVDTDTYEDSSEDYLIEDNVLYADITPVIIKYTKEVTEPAFFDALFIEAFVLKLAAKLAVALSGDQQKEAMMIQQYMLVMQQANKASGKERQPKKQPTKMWSDYG